MSMTALPFPSKLIPTMHDLSGAKFLIKTA